MTYKDKHGYKREPSDSVHRHRAYHHIYLKDRNKYPLPFEAYEVHHIDGNKENNKMNNLAVLTPEQHDHAHDILDMVGLSIEEFRIMKSMFREEYNVEVEQLRKDYEKVCKKVYRKEILRDLKVDEETLKEYPKLKEIVEKRLKFTKPPKYILL